MMKLLSVTAFASLLAFAAHAQGVASTTAAQPAAPPYKCVTNVYIDGVNGNDSNPGTQALPWKSIWTADNGYPNTPVAGECVNVLPGTYTLTSPWTLSHGGNLNTATGYVVYRSTVPQGAHVIAGPGFQSGNGDLVMVNVPFITLDGFEIDGNKSLANGTGIDGCVDGGGPIGLSHHLTVINNKVHDFGLAGIVSCEVDHILISHNTVYNNAGTNSYQGSGISVWRPTMTNEKTYTVSSPYDFVPYVVQITDNVAYNNAEGPAIQGNHTDGNGIIIDTSIVNGVPYVGKILVAGNVAYGNGGGGVHVFGSANTTVANNTVFNNYLDTQNPGTFRGELSADLSYNDTFVGNIAIAVVGQGVLANNTALDVHGGDGNPSTGLTFTNNVLDGPISTDADAVPSPTTNLIGVNPLVVNSAAANFALQATSPAIGYSTKPSYLAPVPADAGACAHTMTSCP